MRKKIFKAMVLALAVFMMVAPLTALADTWNYYTEVTIKDTSGASRTGVPVILDISGTSLNSAGFINASGTDTRMLEGATVQSYGMVGDRVVTFIPTLAANQQRTYRLYMGYSPLKGAADPFQVITGTGGFITTIDNPALELSNGGAAANFTIDQKGYVDTSAGASKYLIYKDGAFYTSNSAASTITSVIYGSASLYSSNSDGYVYAVDSTYSVARASATGVGFPVIAATNTSTNASTTTHTVNLPAGIASGNLLLAFFGCTSNPTVTWPAGWTSLFTAAQSTNETLSAAYRIADGTEGASITVITNSSQTSSTQSYRITSYWGVPEVGTAATGTGTSPDPPNLTPSWGSASNLWFAVCSDSANPNASPTYYYPYTVTGTTPYLGSAPRNLVGTSDNPGAFGSGVGNWVANTVAVKGGGDASSTTFRIGQSLQTATQSQTAQNSDLTLYNGSNTRGAQVISGFTGTITSIQWYLHKGGAIGTPTGTGYVRVRNAVTDAQIGSDIGTIDVSTLTGTYAWKTFNSTPCTVSTPTDIRITFEYSGGDANNMVFFGYKNTVATYFGCFSYYAYGSWFASPQEGATFQSLTYTYYQVDRGAVYFNTSGIGTVTAATLYLYGQNDASATDFNIQVTNGQPTYPHDPLATADYANTNFSGSGGTLSTSGFTTSGYNAIPLNATGLSWINTGGTTKLYLVSDRDVAGTTPTGNEYVDAYSSEQTGTTKDPYLQVFYAAKTISVTGVTSGIRRVVTQATGGGTDLLTLSVYDSVGAHVGNSPQSVALGGAVVLDNSNNWLIDQNNVMPYMDYLKITTAVAPSGEKLWYQPIAMISGTVLPDRDGTQNGAITWGANSNLTVTIGDTVPYNPTSASVSEGGAATTVGPVTDVLSPHAAATITGLPFYSTFNSAATSMGMPVKTLYQIMMLGTAAAVGLGTLVFTGSGLIAALVMAVTMGMGVSAGGGVLGGWMVYTTLVLSVGVLYLMRQH